MTSNVQMVYSQYLKTWGVGSPEWDGYTLHLLRVFQTYLQIHICSPEKEKTEKFWCKKKQIFTPREKSSPISQIVLTVPVLPSSSVTKASFHGYVLITPSLCLGVRWAMVSIDWCIWLLATAIPGKRAFLQIALQCIANPLRMLCMSS